MQSTSNKPTLQNQQANNIRQTNGSRISGHGFEAYLQSFQFCNDETKERNSSMYFNVGQNTFVKYKDQAKQILQIKNKLPQPTFSNTIQSNVPIDIEQEVFYFEVKILNQGTRNLIMIGISEKDFQLNKQLGIDKKAYGYKSDGKTYHGKASGDEYGPKFERYDVIGCGLVMPKKQIFFTYNGRFLGNAFSNVNIQKDQLYASICLQSINEEIQSNFTGSQHDQFMFDLDGFKYDLACAEYQEITKVPVSTSSMHLLVKQYLIHYGYVETLQALEYDSGAIEETDTECISSMQVDQSQQNVPTIQVSQDTTEEECKGDTVQVTSYIPTSSQHQAYESQKSQKIERKLTEDDQIIEGLGFGRQTSQLSDLSGDDYVNQLLTRTARSESVNIEGNSEVGSTLVPNLQFLSLKKRINRSGSLYVEPKITDYVIEMSEKHTKPDSAIYLKDRGFLRHMIKGGEIEEAKNLIQTKFKPLYETNTAVQAYLDVLHFTSLLALGELQQAVDFSINLAKYSMTFKQIKIPSKTINNEDCELEISDFLSLLCYAEPEKSELRFQVSDQQRQLIADKLNNLILCKLQIGLTIIEYGNKGKRSGEPNSQVELMMKHLMVEQDILHKRKGSAGKKERMTDFVSVGQQFVQHYYNTFDTARANLKELYTAESMLTFEGEQFQGVQAILDKFSSFGQIKHEIKSFDAQPSVNNGIICFVSGDLFIEGNENPVKFAQVFQLFPGGSAGFFCFNDMFRLNYG